MLSKTATESCPSTLSRVTLMYTGYKVTALLWLNRRRRHRISEHVIWITAWRGRWPSSHHTSYFWYQLCSNCMIWMTARYKCRLPAASHLSMGLSNFLKICIVIVPDRSYILPIFRYPSFLPMPIVCPEHVCIHENYIPIVFSVLLILSNSLHEYTGEGWVALEG